MGEAEMGKIAAMRGIQRLVASSGDFFHQGQNIYSFCRHLSVYRRFGGPELLEPVHSEPAAAAW